MSEWPEHKYALLLKLHRDGASYGVISRALGVTRSAVAGKVRRRGLLRNLESMPLRPVLPGPGRSAKRPRRRTAPVLPAEDPPELIDRMCTIHELDRTKCRFPFGERGKGFKFCGQPPWGKSPYCTKHHRLTHVKTKALDERALDGRT